MVDRADVEVEAEEKMSDIEVAGSQPQTKQVSFAPIKEKQK